MHSALSHFLTSLLTAFFEIKNVEKSKLFTQEVVAGASGHGLVLLLVQSAGAVVFAWDHVECIWVGRGLPVLCHLASPRTYFKSAVRDAWSAKVARDLSARLGFRNGRFLDFRGSFRLLRSSHVRSGDKGLVRRKSDLVR